MSSAATIDAIDVSNSIFQKAVAFVKDTNENIFLTGKAGTGKTTFLKYIRTKLKKQCAVVAPTGVAAINAGGETIHSFLQLPFSPFIPGSAGGFGRQVGGAEDKHSLLANLRLRDTKLKLLRKLDLLIIDEVSMVRCDLLDSMDLVLRHVRRNWREPFGGVQMLFIGDLFQLPPVVPENDWEILREYYPGPYFFDSAVLRQYPPLYLELKKIYRQKDQDFVDILNRIRNGSPLSSDIEQLNRLHRTLKPNEKGYIMLSTHNRSADKINQDELDKLGGPMHTFKGTITNDFNPKNLPTDETLLLKEGAQVMFVKNDKETPRRYYNGKIGTIDKVDAAGIQVSFEGESNPVQVELETWKSMRYTLNRDKGEIEEEESGSFSQYPLRLAWAITVHKSQGLTLQKAIVDLNQSFAPGQVYVALSRCTSIDGLVLHSKLHIDNVIVDSRVVEFAHTESTEDELDDQLDKSRREAAAARLYKIFSFTELLAQTEQMMLVILKWKTGPKEKNEALYTLLTEQLRKAEGHAKGFHKEVHALTEAVELVRLYERKQAATTYFSTKVMAPLLAEVELHIATLGTLAKVAKQTKAWKEMHELLKQKNTSLLEA